MADENITQPTPPVDNNQPSPAQERITELSSKVKQEAEARVAAESKAAESEKKAAFAEQFIDVISQNPAAKEHKADIQAKVLAGYTVQDATFAVLGAAGKLGNTLAPVAPPSPAGGSATVQIQQNADKPISEMSIAEKRAQLEKELIIT